MESAVANICSPGERVLVVSAGYFGERWAAIANAYGARGRPPPLRVGRDPRARGRRRPPARARGDGRLPDALRDLDRGRDRPAELRGERPRGRRAQRRGRRLEPRRRAARDRRVGHRRRRLRLAEGADDAARPGDGRGLAGRVGEERVRDLAALLLGLGADEQGPGDARPAVHAAGLARRRAERRARDAPGRGPRERLRAPCPARPRLPRGREGDGARALLARRRQRGRRDRGPRAGRHRLRRARPAAPRPARGHARAGPGRAEGEGLPHRPHRLLRRVRHHDRARRGRAGAGRARRRRSSAASPSRARSRPSSTHRCEPRAGPRPGADRRGGDRAPARALRRRRGLRTAISPSASATTTRS